MLTRRRLLASLATLSIQQRISASAQLFPRRAHVPPAPLPLVFFGTDTDKPGAKGIYRARFDTKTGQFSAPVLAAETFRPVFFAINEIAGMPAPKTKLQSALRHFLYVTNEGDAKTSGISTFALNPDNGDLKFLSQVSSGAAGPCYIDVDAAGKVVFVADYAGSAIAGYRVLPDGTLSQPIEIRDFHDPLYGKQGPVKARQDAPHPHSSMITPDNRFVVVNDLGNDSIAFFPILAEPGKLGEPKFFRNLAPGSGPRHIAFHPNGRWAYGIDELSSRLDQYLYTSMHTVGTMGAQAALAFTGNSISTLPPSFTGSNTAAEVDIAPLGDFLYASNRGDNSLVVFAIDSTTGALTLRQRISCGGKTPRQFTFDHTTNWIVCGNQDSASVTVFARNPATGLLTGPVQTLPIESPMYTLFV